MATTFSLSDYYVRTAEEFRQYGKGHGKGLNHLRQAVRIAEQRRSLTVWFGNIITSTDHGREIIKYWEEANKARKAAQ